MVSRMKMLGGVAVWRIVAATDVSASATQTQMKPLAAALETFFTTKGARCDVLDAAQV